jgi:positive regulator of sigma E activity
MNAEQLLLVIFGLVAGGCLGYVTAWRFARKLEAHEVVLADWDCQYDMQAPKQPAKFGRGA